MTKIIHQLIGSTQLRITFKQSMWSDSIDHFSQAIAISPFFWIKASRRKAGPLGFLTPRSQSETRFLETFR